MYKCKYCGEEFDIPQKLGGHVLSVHKKENHGSISFLRERRKKYEENPVLCKECGKPIPFDKIRKDKHKAFCDSSCSASFNNKRRNKKEPIFCILCGKELIKGQKLFCCIEHDNEYKKRKIISEWLDGKETSDDTVRRSKSIRNFILTEQENKCAICGHINIWNNKPLVFVLDHIDGNADNNGRDNIRLICPMCDSQTDTFKGRNKGNGREYRRKHQSEY